MKKILLFIFMIFILPISVNANDIFNIDIDVALDKNGDAIITENWVVDGSDGTEWYKVINNLGNMNLSNFTVSMDGKPLTYKDWDIDESLSQKKGYYGINYTSDGLELCFGKYDYNRHTFTLSYTLSNFIINTSDSQLIYYNFIDKMTDVDVHNFSVDISSYYAFPDTLDVWGYGYKGYAYVDNGKISMSNEENTTIDNSYVVLLAKFPLNTFNTFNTISGYDNFDTVYNMAKKGSYDYDYSNDSSFILDLFAFLINNIYIIIFIITGIFGAKKALDNSYGYSGNKKIDKNNVPMFRDIPCSKDIYYADTLMKVNKFDYKEGNILGAIILKWVKNDKIRFKNEQTGMFNKETSVIDLTLNPTFDNEYEQQLS